MAIESKEEEKMVRFSHVGLVVADLNRSIEFYAKTLGLKCLEQHPDTGRGLDIAFLGSDAPVLELLCYKDATKAERPARGRYDHFAWYVDDLDQMMQDLQDKGVEFVPPEAQTVLDGRKIAFFFGPDGERVELVQPAGK